MIDEINHFIQMDDESMYEVWERYKDLLRRCPQHMKSENQLITTFHSGLTEEIQENMNFTAGGTFVHKFNIECKRIIEEMAANSNRSSGCSTTKSYEHCCCVRFEV